jgi:SAM-dependent methyltransferase
VLDLGCGGGIQALHASRHAEHVVATDLSERALAFAAFNAALNGIELELRHGSLLEPVAGEEFDLVVSNPPFVITPRSTDAAHGAWTYRDGGRAGDTLLAELLAQLPAHLAPGGSAVMLGNWEITETDDPFAHPRAWLAPALEDCVDAWVLQRDQEDPAEYAATWARDGGITSRDPRWEELVGAWLEDFASRDVAAIGFGYLLLRRPDQGVEPSAPTGPGLLRTEHAPGAGSGTLAAHLAASLAALRSVSSLDDEALAATRPVRAEDVVERRHLTPGQWDPMLIELVQGAGLARTVTADQALAATVGALDGTLTLGQVVAAVCALTDADEDATRAQILPVVRELAITGMVTL